MLSKGESHISQDENVAALMYLRAHLVFHMRKPMGYTDVLAELPTAGQSQGKTQVPNCQITTSVVGRQPVSSSQAL